MIDDRPIRKLWYSEKPGPNGTVYVLWRGDTVVGGLTSQAEADIICHNDQERRRMASDRSNDLRKHHIEKSRRKQETQVLVGTLQKVTAVLRTCNEREMQKAKEEAGLILRKYRRLHAGHANAHAGFTVVEALVVMALAFMLLTVAVSVVSQGINASRIRAASQQLTMDLRLARLTAVTKRTTIDFVVSDNPINAYQYLDIRGKIHREVMPPGVRLTGSPTTIHFLPNGSVLGGASTILEVALTDSIVERRTIDTSVLGVPRLTVARLAS